MVTFEPIVAGELATRTGRLGVVYGDASTSKAYFWDGVTSKFSETRKAGPTYRAGVTITGAATLTAAELATGAIIYTGGAASVTLPTATLLGTALRAGASTQFDFAVDNTGGSGTCTIVVGTGIVAGPAVVTGGATLTVAASATQGIGLFRLVFSSATAAVLFRIG